MSSDPTTQCPADDTLGAFSEGGLDAATRTRVLAHIETCSDCMAAVLSANAHLEEERGALPSRRSSSSRWWLAAVAAAILIAIVGVPLYLRHEEPVARLVALAPRSVRRVEPRLTGGFAWAAYAGTERAVGSTPDATQMKLGGIAGELVEQADRDGGAAAQHAAGVAMMLIEAPADAVPRLEAAVAKANDAKSWSDLAAARYAAASQLGRASLYPAALAAADAALRIDPKLAEALFNRALILERLGLTEEARRAWRQYLDVDSSSDWATEARARLAALPVSTRSSQFERDRPLLERAAEEGDASAAREYVARYRDRARAFAEGEYLARWAEALQRSDAAAAERSLRMARGIGDALVQLSGESMVRDAVAAIDRASDSERRSIAAAHLLYKRARIAYSRDVREAVDADLLHAAGQFESARDPMALMARCYAASVRLARSETAGARADLERARADADAHPTYISLGAQIRWELGRARMLDYDWSGAALVLGEGAAMFHRAEARGSEAFVEIMLAQALSSLGREDDAWLARMRAFAALSTEGEAVTQQLAASVGSAMHDELLKGQRESALALSALEIAIARSASRPQLLVDALANRAQLAAISGDPAGALAAAREAEAIAKGIPDEALRGRTLAVAEVALGAALAENDPGAAAEPLSRAIDFYVAHDLPAFLPEPLLLRARCAVRARDHAAAAQDLERGMAIVEKHGPAIAGTGVLDTEHSLFTDAVRLALDRGDVAAAFRFAERSRGTAVTLAEIQQRLAGSDAAVLEIVALPAELVTFAITENDAVLARRPRASGTLVPLADETLSESGTTASAALYDDVIRPVDRALSRVRELVIVADPRLRSVPFAALYDRSEGRYLIERFAVSIAASAGSLQPAAVRVAVPSLAAIALPAGGTESMGLPEAEQEVREVASLYAHTESIGAGDATLAALTRAAGGADVVHIAGHTEQQPGGGEQALLFVGSPGNLERVSWKTIVSAPPVHHGVVVLAACETLRAPASAATRALSLGGAFSAAGASDVVGTLAPIGDRDARLLFAALHRQLASGARPAEALRQAQLEAVAREKTDRGRRAWRAVALLTRRTPAPQR